MTVIRSLADDLREKMRQQASVTESPADTAAQALPAAEKIAPQKKTAKPPPGKPPPQLESLLRELSDYALTGNEKLLIRLDSRTMFMLKQLKVTKGIDMNKLIAYSLETFFKERPELITYIKASLQTIEL